MFDRIIIGLGRPDYYTGQAVIGSTWPDPIAAPKSNIDWVWAQSVDSQV